MCPRMRENRSFAGRHPRLHHHNHSLRYFSLSLSLSLSALPLSVSLSLELHTYVSLDRTSARVQCAMGLQTSTQIARLLRVILRSAGWLPTAGFMTHVACRLTAKNQDQNRNPTVGNRVWASFTFTQICGGTHAVRHKNSSIGLVRLVNYSQCHRRTEPDTAGRRAITRTSLPVAKSSTSSAAVRRECRLCRVAGNTV